MRGPCVTKKQLVAVDEKVAEARGEENGDAIHQWNIACELVPQGTVIVLKYVELATVNEFFVNLELMMDEGRLVALPLRL